MSLSNRSALALTALLASCVGGPPVSDEPLPLHLGIVFDHDPDSGGWKIEDASFLADSDVQADEELTLFEDEAGLSNALGAAIHERLAGSEYVRVSVLEAPDSLAAADWSAALEERGIDVVARLELEYSPYLGSRQNELWIPNTIVYLAVGPGSWFVPDRSHFMDVAVRGELLDARWIGDRLDPDEYVTRSPVLTRLSAQVQELSSTFYARMGNNVNAIVPSVIVPPAFLSGDAEQMIEGVEREIVESLTQGIARQLVRRHEAILAAPTVSEFHVDELRWEQTPDGLLHVTGHVILDRSRLDAETLDELFFLAVGTPIDALPEERLEISPGPPAGWSRSVRFGSPLLETATAADEPTDRTERHPFALDVRAEEHEWIRLVVVDAQGDRRTYTLGPLAPASEPAGELEAPGVDVD